MDADGTQTILTRCNERMGVAVLDTALCCVTHVTDRGLYTRYFTKGRFDCDLFDELAAVNRGFLADELALVYLEQTTAVSTADLIS